MPKHLMTPPIKKYWFIIGLFITAVITLADPTKNAATAGKWLKLHHGPDIIIAVIFFLSGLILESAQIKRGLYDTTSTLSALTAIFFLAPLLASFFSYLSVKEGVLIGLFLVAAMPTTLSSGVVMTGAAGGNMAHALLITVISNCISVLTIPITLVLLISLIGGNAQIRIDGMAIMCKISLFVILPLGIGLGSRQIFPIQAHMHKTTGHVQNTNQSLILMMVWMALSQTRESIVTGFSTLTIIILAVTFHGLMLAMIGGLIKLLKIGRGRRESVLLMGGQKTLALSILLQSFLFPQYGSALAFCVIHHIVHLSMDGYLVEKLKPR